MGEKQCYTVVETKGYLKDLKKDADLNRYLPSIQKFVELLPENPFQKGVKKLEGRNDEYRQEFGRKRRLIFSIDKKLKVIALLQWKKKEGKYVQSVVATRILNFAEY
ncbi:hypothetical protein CEXT_433161 [Caerostris extrusa]|uniref:Uncharacterized protein n=1 Tax=Caerostris extrusa TaxID=172846 RepID=A0AAV4QXW0_CAEEX|nr:hypothetical protein CEXT_433161 [Caerostris extrusa]